MSISDYYRCGEGLLNFGPETDTSGSSGFFRFGSGAVCYGQLAGDTRSYVNGNLFDASKAVQIHGSRVSLPFDVDQVLDNLRFERYVTPGEGWLRTDWARKFYYALRPCFPLSLRRHLQRVYLRGWQDQTFPGWPVDRSVDVLSEHMMVLALKAANTDRMPFIWFWPKGHQACAIVTHDIETLEGRERTSWLMDIDETFGIKASIQVVPERRYAVPADFLNMIRERGFDINVHGLDHDGNLFEDRAAFLKRARKINEYAALWGSRGFRSPTMYRNADWMRDLNFSYDMSVPNVARLEPQQGGCCTVMPYFLPGGMLELPLTMAQDYTLFHVLKDYSMALWNQQIDLIRNGHGLISLIVHPDYVDSIRAQSVYRQLLEKLEELRSTAGVWVTLAGEVDRWWRQRKEMILVPDKNGWKVEGPGSERAVVAYACLDGDQLSYEVPRQ